MPESAALPKLAICPDCGGILHPPRPERLTSAEVSASSDPPETEPLYQCLLCGYVEARADATDEA